MAQLLFYSLVNNEKKNTSIVQHEQFVHSVWSHIFLENFLFSSFLCSLKDKFLNVEQPESAQNSGNAFASEPSSHSCVRFHQLFARLLSHISCEINKKKYQFLIKRKRVFFMFQFIYLRSGISFSSIGNGITLSHGSRNETLAVEGGWFNFQYCDILIHTLAHARHQCEKITKQQLHRLGCTVRRVWKEDRKKWKTA